MRLFLDEKRAQLQRQKMVRGTDLIACRRALRSPLGPSPVILRCEARGATRPAESLEG